MVRLPDLKDAKEVARPIEAEIRSLAVCWLMITMIWWSWIPCKSVSQRWSAVGFLSGRQIVSWSGAVHWAAIRLRTSPFYPFYLHRDYKRVVKEDWPLPDGKSIEVMRIKKKIGCWNSPMVYVHE
jgi:hypothetical protein